jgi:hypothetical protein
METTNKTIVEEITTHLKEFPTHKYCEECDCCIGCDCCMCNKCVCDNCNKEIDLQKDNYDYDDAGFLCDECMPKRDEEEEKNEYMEEDMGECPKCDCAVKRKDLAWRNGYYLDICAKCDEEENEN